MFEDEIGSGAETFFEGGEGVEDGGKDFFLRELDIDFIDPESGFELGLFSGAFRTVSDDVQLRHFLGVLFGKIREIGINEEFIERDFADVLLKPLEMGLDQMPPNHPWAVEDSKESFFQGHQIPSETSGNLSDEGRRIFEQRHNHSRNIALVFSVQSFLVGF